MKASFRVGLIGAFAALLEAAKGPWGREVGRGRRLRPSRYMPHQGVQECARRRSRMGSA